MKICLFGGSFDPIHEGHLHIAQGAKDACAIDRVLFLPCAQSPLKTSEPHASDEERCEMVRLAIDGFDWAELDTTDLELPAPSWSWRVAESVKRKHPEDELFWLIGTDQWADLEKWGRWEYLADLVTFIFYHRGDHPVPREGVRALFVEGNHDASSTQIRHCLNQGDNVPFLAESVERFIRQKDLYRSAHDAV